MATQYIRLHDFSPPEHAYHIARVSVLPGKPFPIHRQDCCELFVVEENSLVHLVNGVQVILEPGAVCLVRAADCHGFSCATDNACSLVNIAFDKEILARIQKQYFSHKSSFWGGTAQMPVVYHLRDKKRAVVERVVSDLLWASRTRLEIDRFLLNILHELDEIDLPVQSGQIPAWLHEACIGIRNPHFIKKGTDGFVELACRCAGHVARQTKKYLDKTPSEIVNEARLDFAASRLIMTTETIPWIAADCGIKSLAHFYTLFTARFGVSPKKYRDRYRHCR